MDEKIQLLLLVISLSLLHHEVQTQKANFCNVTESYFVEVTKTETILGFKKPTGILGMFSGNKYENITRNVLGVEKRERVVEECCKGYKKKDNQCVPIDETKPSEEPPSSSTTTTTAAPSFTPTTTSPATEPSPASSSSEPAPAPQTSASESAPSTDLSSPEPISAQANPTSAPGTPPSAPSEVLVITAPEPAPSSTAAPITAESVTEAKPQTIQLNPTSAPETPSPVASESPEPAPSSTAAPIVAEFVTEVSTSESVVLAQSSAASPTTQPNLVSELTSTSETSTAEVLAAHSSETFPPPQIDAIVSESAALNEPTLSSLVAMVNTVTTSVMDSYSSSESVALAKPTSSNHSAILKESEKLVNEDMTTARMDLTTIMNLRRKRSLNQLSNAVDSINILDVDSESKSESDSLDDFNDKSGSDEDDFKLNEGSVSKKKKHDHSFDSENIVVSDLTADIEDQGYPWIEILEVLSFGAVVFLLVITVQASFDSESLSLWRANSKIPQDIDSYSEFWVYDSQGNLQEV